MKLLVFGDNHGDEESLQTVIQKAKHADFIVCLGDFTWFGEKIEKLISLLNTMPKKMFLMHGNHEQEEIVRLLTNNMKTIEFAHKKIMQVGEYDVIMYGGGGFSLIDETFETFAQNIKKQIRDPHKTILILHAPPHNTALDVPFENYHSGTISFRNFIEEIQPLAVFAGHIHDTEGKFDYIEATLLHNPGPFGAMIDLADLHQQRKNKQRVKIKK